MSVLSGAGNIAKKAIRSKEDNENLKTKDLSQNEKTLNKVLKTMGLVLAKIISSIVTLLVHFLPITLAVVFFAVLIGGFLSIINEETNKDTDEATIDAAVIINSGMVDTQFKNEVLQMIQENKEDEEIRKKVREKIIDEGITESLADEYVDYVLMLIKGEDITNKENT